MQSTRILLISDTHYCHQHWYGLPNADRQQKLIDDLIAEYQREPYAMILHLGDLSLDYWECGPLYGSYSNGGVSNTANFLREYAVRLPCPLRVLPGNHEQYTHEDWRRITGGQRQYYIVWDNYLLFMLDNFADNLNSPQHHHGTYSYADASFIRQTMATQPDKKALLFAHEFDISGERDDFKRLVRENDNILGLFAGHTHSSAIIALGGEYGGKCLYRTGNYSYSSSKSPVFTMWGYRELRFGDTGVSTAYIVPDNTITIDGQPTTFAHHRQDGAVISHGC